MPRPSWLEKWPERLDYELKALEKAGASFKVDDAALESGYVALDLRWMLGERPVILRAVYPDEFPDLRPQVFAPDEPAGRHVHPWTHSVCLAGRGSENWSANMTLADLLSSKLQDALAASSNPGSEMAAAVEEHEGVPAEEWWNELSIPGSYCLIDSGWSIDRAHSHGRLRLRCSFVPNKESIVVRCLIDRVMAADDTVLAEWTQPIPEELRNASLITVPWARSEEEPLPRSMPVDLEPLLKAHPIFSKYQPSPVFGTRAISRATCHCILYRTELAYREPGDGWLMMFNIIRQAPKPGQIVPVERTVPRCLRAGKADLGFRVPAVAALRDKRIAIFGMGAIGAPIALEIARNGASELRLIDPDTVDPGITIRWPLGISAWGKPKIEAIAEEIARQYPSTRLVPLGLRVGSVPPPGGEHSPANQTLGDALDVDLVIDATAEIGVNRVLDERCRERALPLITCHATPTIEGGMVARHIYAPGQGCRTCLELGWRDRTIPEPLGTNATLDQLKQPPGCAERTFIGAGFDLVEVSLQVVRLAVDTLSNRPLYPAGSVANILGFRNEAGQPIPPVWCAHAIPRHPECHNPHL